MSTSSHTRCSIEGSRRAVSARAIRKAVPALVAGVALVLACCQAQPNRVTVFLSGDSLGYLEPCGCRRDQAGGLPGRARLLEPVDKGARLVLDVGNMTAGTRDYDLLKFGYMLEGMEAIGYDAVNLGRTEAGLDLDVLRSALAKSSLPFVSANVLSKKSHEPLAEPFRIVRRAGLNIGVVGVTACDPLEAGPGVEVRPPLEALAERVPGLRKQCDFLVVLAFVDEETQKQIADKFHEVDMVLGGDVPQPSTTLQQVNRASLYSVTNKGKVVGRMELERQSGSFRVLSASQVRIAADKIEPPKAIGDLLLRYKTELRDRRYELASIEGMERIESREMTADQFVGDTKCASCHQGAHKTWLASAHSRAFETLKRVKSEYDPDCLRCHTVGYARSSGFIDELKTKHLRGVQCENCHGRGKDHMAKGLKTTLKPVTPSTCVNCHDEENSENFKYPAFWPRIAH